MECNDLFGPNIFRLAQESEIFQQNKTAAYPFRSKFTDDFMRSRRQNSNPYKNISEEG
jgi:hypothetical protein